MTTIDSRQGHGQHPLALGAAQINYYGFSYGTYLGQVYSTLFPTHVRRMVLDSNVDPRHVWYAANLDQDIAFDRNINIWFGWLAEAQQRLPPGRDAEGRQRRSGTPSSRRN